MSLLDFLRRPRSAGIARERLEALLAHERGGADLATILEREILAVIARHIPIDRDKVMVKLRRGARVSTLEIGIEAPAEAFASA